MSYRTFNANEARKVAAFVTAIAEVEDRFGYRLDVGPSTTSSPVTVIGPEEHYAIFRESSTAPLTPAMEMK